MTTTKRALVLGGGGAMGSAQAAYMKAAHELGFEADLVVGTSVGALNGAWAAMHPTDPDGLLDVWRGLHRSRVLRLNPLTLAARMVRLRAGISTNLIVPRLIAAHLGAARFDQTVIPLAIVATNLSEGKKAVFRAGRLEQAILASTAIPGVFDPVEIGGQLYVDGCVTASVDLATAIDLGATEILAIDLTPASTPGRPRGAYGVLRRSLGVLAHATTDAMEAIASRQMPVCVVRPDLTLLSPWRVDFDDAGIERSLAEARRTLRAVIGGDGHLAPRLEPGATYGPLATPAPALSSEPEHRSRLRLKPRLSGSSGA